MIRLFQAIFLTLVLVYLAAGVTFGVWLINKMIGG
jgi:hypothetical protein